MKTSTKRLGALVLIACMLLSVAACGGTGTPPTETPAAEQPAVTPADATAEESAGFKPGTYQSTQIGHNAPIDVSVTFSEDAITAIDVTRNLETAGVSTKSLTELPQSIVETQTLNVDTITGSTISSMALLRAVEDCVKQAGGDPEAMKPAKEAAAPTEIAKTADVIVVGGGGAGLSAAVSATQSGASVIIVEKNGYVGGNSMVSGGIYNAADPDMQKDIETSEGVEALVVAAYSEEPQNDLHKELMDTVKKEFAEYKASGSKALFDSPSFHALQTWNGGDKVADLTLVKQLAFQALDSLHWVMDMGYEIKDFINQGAGSLYQRTHSSVKPLGTGFIDAFMEKLSSANAEVIYSTTANELIVQDGKVVGVKAQDKKGNTYTLHANKNVVLATGGFGGDAQMVQRFNTTGKWPDLSKTKSTNLPSITGDGIKMAETIGAALRDMDMIQLLQTCSAKNGLVYGNVYPGGIASYILLNKEGKRFAREDGRRDDVCLAGLQQTDSIYYIVVSGDSITDPDNTLDLGGIPLNDLVEMGDIIKGDTLADACNQLGIDPVAAQETIDAFNKLVDEGALQDEFGRALLTQKLETGPWYFNPRSPSVHHTMGGVVINENCQVLNEQGEAIPGLYAAGEVTGGIHGGNRLGGNAIVDFVVFGRIAGEQAAK